MYDHTITMAQRQNVLEVLQHAKKAMLETSQLAGAEGDWDLAKKALQWAQQLDQMTVEASTPVFAPNVPVLMRGVAQAQRTALPRYYVDRDRLIKVGASRDGGMYKHSVTRSHFDGVIDRLEMVTASDGLFDMSDVLRHIDIPRHEPLIVTGALANENILKKVRRGRWLVVDRINLKASAQRAWEVMSRFKNG